MQKYAFDEARPVLERASARETAARVALGPRWRPTSLEQAVGARIVLPRDPARGRPAPPTACGRSRTTWPRLDDDPVRCPRPQTPRSRRSSGSTRRTRTATTLGGVVEVVVHGLPPALGSHVHCGMRLVLGGWTGRPLDGHPGDQGRRGRRRLRARPRRRLAGARRDGAAPNEGIRRVSGRSGGTEGGMTTGAVLRVRAASRRSRSSTAPRARRTVDVATGAQAVAHHQRSDVVRRTRRRDRRRGDGRAGPGRRGAREVRRRRPSRQTRRNAESYLDTLRFR